jgi:hypothetical protein
MIHSKTPDGIRMAIADVTYTTNGRDKILM